MLYFVTATAMEMRVPFENTADDFQIVDAPLQEFL